MASGSYRLEVMASSDSNGIVSIQDGVSINDHGNVAFSAVTQNGTGVFIAKTPHAPKLINPGSSENVYGPGVQINNSDLIFAQEQHGFVYTIDMWNGNATDSAVEFVKGVNVTGYLLAVYPYVSGNNIAPGQAVYRATLPGHRLLATGGPLASNANLRDETFPIRPMLADSSRVVARDGNLSTSPIKMWNYNFSSPVTIGSATDFDNMGLSPGISDGRDAVAFYGELKTDKFDTTAGAGIFVNAHVTNDSSSPRQTIRVAGTGVQGAYNFTAFSHDDRVGVNMLHGIFGDPLVVYLAYDKPLDTPADDPATLGLYTSHVHLTGDGSTFIVDPPVRVLQVGQSIQSVGVVQSISLYDPVNIHGDVVCLVSTGSQQAVIRARCSPLVVFIPGMAGSTLRNAEGTELWYAIISSKLDKLVYGADLTIFAADALRTALVKDIYAPLLNELESQDGFTEYQTNGDPRRRTSQGWDMSQRVNAPNLFVFPFDWRLPISGDAVAEQLQDFIAGIHRFYPDSNVSIVAHSTGGLLARRYLLYSSDKGRNPYVDRLVTIGSPWLGAPKAIATLETGQFLGGPFDWFNSRLDSMSSGAFKRIAETCPGPQQLMPSRDYYRVAGASPYFENGFPLSYEQWVRDADTRYAKDPGAANKALHDDPRQDDWTSDPPDLAGIKLLHIYGQQKRYKTITNVNHRVVTMKSLDQFGSLIVIKQDAYIESFGPGDGTVPVESASRRSGAAIDLNSPRAIVWPICSDGFTDDSDEAVEHTKLTKNPAVHDLIMSFLNDQLVSPPPKPCPVDPGNGYLSYYMTFNGVDFVHVLDASGNTNTPMSDDAATSVPGVTYDVVGDGVVQLALPADQTFNISFQVGGNPVGVEWLAGADNVSPAAATRYQDVALPPGTLVSLNISAGAVDSLRYDSNGDGVPDSVVAPTVSLIGAAAGDTTPPTLVFSKAPQGTHVVVTVTATDTGSGVRDIYYSLDGVHIQPYSSPIGVDPRQTSTVYAFSDDNAANRSGLESYKLAPDAGDVNGDGRVDIADVVTILRSASGLGTVSFFARGDVAPKPSADPRGYGNGILDMPDALRVMRYISDLETLWP
jgi:pimeloyl-ACP methyl ester carboxylesterase